MTAPGSPRITAAESLFPVSERRKTSVPRGRLSRFVQMGATVSRIAAGGLKEGTKRLVKKAGRELPHALLTVENAQLLADRLSRLRGAAMKLGQMLSMEGDHLLPPEVAKVLEVLRKSADMMPEHQVRSVLLDQYGAGWEKRFQHFDFEPIAAASIGQVHRATSADGRDVALKIQYPGIASSIDSDVDNLSALLGLTRVLSGSMDLGAITAELKRQLREEVDYLREQQKLLEYTEKISGLSGFTIPAPHPDLSTSCILAMEYIDAPELAEWLQGNVDQAKRDELGERLLRLLLRELFDFHLVQTDPNFANYLYDEKTDRIVLLDFGATRAVPERFVHAYSTLLRALATHDRDALHRGMLEVGALAPAVPDNVQQTAVDTVFLAREIFQPGEKYDFSRSDLAERFRDAGKRLVQHKSELTSPPPEIIFFQRKLGGSYLQCRSMRARVDCHALAREVGLATF